MRREEPCHQNGDHGKNNYLGVSRKKLDGLSYRLEKETHDRADDAVVLLISCRPFPTPLPSEFREVIIAPISANVSPSGKDNSSDSEPIFSEYFFYSFEKLHALFALRNLFSEPCKLPFMFSYFGLVRLLCQKVKRFCH